MKKITPGHILIKWLDASDKKEIKTARGKKLDSDLRNKDKDDN